MQLYVGVYTLKQAYVVICIIKNKKEGTKQL